MISSNFNDWYAKNNDDFLYNIHRMMLEKKLILIYNGEFSQDLTKVFLSMTQKNLEYLDEEKNVKKKVFHIMVECLQNICKHADADDPENKNTHFSTFAVGRFEDEYIVFSGNWVKQEKTVGLLSMIDKINRLDKEGLTELYMEKISSGSLSEKGGAGLGLIDIAKKSGNKLFYKLYPGEGPYSFFTLITSINTNKSKPK